MDGVPCIRGLRIPVATVVGIAADRMTVEEILAAYSDLASAGEPVEDLAIALHYRPQTLSENAEGTPAEARAVTRFGSIPLKTADPGRNWRITDCGARADS